MNEKKSLSGLYRLLGAFLCMALLIVPLGRAQQKPGASSPPSSEAKTDNDSRTKKDDFIIRTEVNMVNLPVTVRSHTGGFVKGLKKDLFHVYEDGVEQEISLFSQEQVPAHLVLLIDISESVRYEWGSIKNAARRFVAQLGPEDKVSVVVFNHETRLIQDWTNAAAKVSTALDSVFPKGRTFLWDALYVAADEMLRDVKGKKAIILLSDGFDNCVSGIDIHPKRCVDYPEGLDMAIKSGAMVYVVSEVQALRNQMEFAEKENGYRLGIPADAFIQVDLLLKKLAFETGGKVLYPDTFGELGNVYAQVAEELKNQYSIGYVSSNTFKDGTYRKVRVAVEKEKTTATTRPGYFAPKQS